MLYDTHAHLNFKAFKDDWPEVIARAQERGVGIIIPSTDLVTSRKAIEIAEKYEKGVYAAVGLHPIHIYKETLDINEYRQMARHPKVVALGEVGLDDFHAYLDHPIEEAKELQREVLKEFIALSSELNLPLILHCRPASAHSGSASSGKEKSTSEQNTYDDLATLLEDVYIFSRSYKKEVKGGARIRGVVHCFLGTFPQAQKFFDLGFMVSLGGVVTYPWFDQEVVRQCPLEKIMLDTDSPYLSPEPARKTRNEPVNVEIIARHIAEIKKIEYSEVEKATTENAQRLFSKIF